MNKDKITKIMICKTEKSRTNRSKGFPGGSDGKETACNPGDRGSIPRLGRSPGGGHWQRTLVFLPGHKRSKTWTEEPGGLQSMVSQRVEHD